MKTGKSLQELAAEITRQSRAKIDYVADTRELQMTDTADIAIPVSNPHHLRETMMMPHEATPTTHQQIANRLGIPKKYYDRMLGESPGLLARNVNHWFESNPERRLVRTLDGRARAFLSDRYQRIDNNEVAEVVLPILAEIPDVQIMSCEITERRMYIKAVSPRVRGEVTVGDEVQAGVTISNSEIGFGSLNVNPFVLVLRCLNGWATDDGRFRKYHVGSRIQGDGVLDVLSDEAIKADDKAILLKVRDVVKAAVDDTVFKRTVGRMRAAAENRIEGNPVKAVEILSNKLVLTEGESGSVLTNLIQSGELTQYGIGQAVTAVANNHADYDRATEIEAMGGKILDLAPKEWKEIAEAA